ncbi:transcriptional protein SWT1-like [Argiope bruennichi]|uniref:transcriptional protein SWT1-like n=1 Tax=Argiope bruennichi TaxID=94029 RepID=UPI00249494D9|nr:transcriptional protein SWT1-like [Argiope bruennichi]
MDDTATKGSLPDGWIVKVSKNFPDRVYYFNIYTGSSTWECPKLDPPGSNKIKKMKSLNILNKQASSGHTVAHTEAKSPDLSSKIKAFLLDAKRESQKRSVENDTPSSPSLHSKFPTPPTAIVAPVILDKKVTSVTKKKKKRSKKKPNLAASDVAVSPATGSLAGTILQRKDSDDATKKVSFTVKSQNKIPISKSESTILSKSKKFTPVFKKKESLVISVPTAAKPGNPISRGMRCVTLDKNKPLLSSTDKKGDTKGKETLSLHHKFPSARSEKEKLNVLDGCKVDKQYKLPSQSQLNENIKRKSAVLNTNSGEDLSTSKSKSLYESDGEISEMDCEMNSDCEESTLKVSPTEVNIGASTSRISDQDSFDDIEMLDMSSSDLVRIDDMFGFAFQGSLMERHFIVVDTNIFISELSYIKEMKDTPVNGCGPPHFIIPWVVFQELDSLKKNGARPKAGVSKDIKIRKTYDVMKSSGEAIRYLNTLLKAKHPRFHFQHPDEAKNCRKDFSRNNDDQLLECCLKLQERMPKEKVILLTNDKNLANKAMVCDIVVHDKMSLLNTLKSDLVINENLPKNLPNPTYVPDHSKVLVEQKSLEQKYGAIHKKCELEIDAHMSEARQLLIEVLDPLFEKEMDIAYGDAWHFFPVERHTLKGILYGIVRYWRTVFTFLFSREDQGKFEMLQEKVKRPEGFLGEREECLNILKTIEDLFIIIKRKWSDIQVPVAEVRKIKELTEESFSNLSESEKNLINIENAIKQSEMSCCIEVFNHNWTVINHLCGCTLDFCGIPHDLVYDKSVPFPPKSEFIRIMPKLQTSLSRLKDVMERMLLVVKSSSTNGSVFKDLHKILKELVPSLNIQVERISVQHFSAKVVERFCRLPENRPRIEEGYKQLLNFHEKLGNALHVLLTEK